MTLLAVDGLNVGTEHTPLVKDVSFALEGGERVGLIGESGSGKSLTALAVLGLLPEGVRASGSIQLGGAELVGARERELGRIRGKDIAMVFQEPMTSLDPTQRVGKQVAEALRVHGVARAAARSRAAELLESVGLPERTARAYPHQLSGGQRQRVVLAIALANRPAVLLCDEPTTALDVTVQAQILALIEKAITENDSALLFITHDLAVVATICERVLVMYGGRIVESGVVREVFRRPRHRYTEGLLAASDLTATVPTGIGGKGRLPTIPGSVPGAGRFPAGCVFRTRCAHATSVCEELPAWTETETGGFACWHPAKDPA
jgi:oligopeptide/dipeptide ABC transporter ATP-binding protein